MYVYIFIHESVYIRACPKGSGAKNNKKSLYRKTEGILPTFLLSKGIFHQSLEMASLPINVVKKCTDI